MNIPTKKGEHSCKCTELSPRQKRGNCEHFLHTVFIFQIDGCYDFYVNAEDIKLGARMYGSWGRLVISANVTEEQTGETL